MATTTSADIQAPQNGEAASAPLVRVLTQFIRDLSFENPRAPESLRPTGVQPQIDISVELSARTRPDQLFEVDLKLAANAKHESESVFQIELLYGGLFQIQGISEEALESVLLIECPRFLFPFVRKVIADLTIEGGFPPFLLDPIDFAAIYAARREKLSGNPAGQA